MILVWLNGQVHGVLAEQKYPASIAYRTMPRSSSYDSQACAQGSSPEGCVMSVSVGLPGPEAGLRRGVLWGGAAQGAGLRRTAKTAVWGGRLGQDTQEERGN